MNAISKRLLSGLMVLAMVLSMVPVLDLSNFAVETQAAEEIVYGSANLTGVDAAILEQMEKGNAIDNSDAAIDAAIAAGTCPMCGATEVTWVHGEKVVPTINASTDTANTDGKTHHYYFDTTIAHTNNFIGMMGKNGTVCVALKSTADITCQKYRVMMGGTDNVLNIMGTGKLHADQSVATSADGDLGLIQVSAGTVNLYGGNFTHAHMGTDFRKAAIRVTGAAAVINIFDGVKIGPETQDTTKVTQNVQYSAAGTVNMFGGVIRNGVAPAWGYSGNVTVSSSGKFNMYGGTIENGTFLSSVTEKVTSASTIGGNVMVGGKNQQVAFKDDGSDINYTCSAGTFNMYGGTVKNGKANNGGNGGGNINIYHGSAVMNMQGGTVEGGYAKAVGGNIQVVSGALNISGTALITGGESISHGGNIHINHASGKLNISGGKIVEGETTGASANGGNIYADKVGSLTISGGIIDGGHTAGSGGNLYLATEAEGKVTISGGTFQNGVAEKTGGNIGTAVTLTLSDATLKDGTSRTGGGNIKTVSQNKKLTLNNCIVSGGWVTGAWDEATETYKPTGANWGGNISAWVCDVEINGGLYYNGYRGPEKSAHQGNNISCLSSVEKTATSSLNGCTLTIGGDAVIVGDVNVSSPSSSTDGNATSPGTTLVLKDAPQIVSSYELNGETVKASYGGLNLPAAVQADIDDLSQDAAICLNTAKGRVITKASENAANVAGCFSVYNNADLIATVNDSNELVISEKPFEFEAPVKPEAALGGQNVTDEVWAEVVKAAEIQAKAKVFKLDADGMGACPVCGETVKWTEATKPGQTDNWTKSRHYYIDADTEVKKNYNWLTVAGAKKNEDGSDADATITAENVTVCLMLLNGDAAKEIGGMIGIRNSTKNVTFNIMGDGIITSDGKSTNDGQFGVVSLQGTGNTVNLYGGTFIYSGDGEGRAKDADGVYQPTGTPAAAALNVKGNGNTVNMFDGVVIGPETQDLTKVNYNVRLEIDTAKMINTFNMYGGTIRNGVSNDVSTGGNVHLHYNSAKTQTKPTFNMYGGTIENGSYVQGEGVTSVKLRGGNIYAGQGSQLSIYGGTITGGKADLGGNIYAIDSSLSRINISGGTITGGHATTGGNFYCYTIFSISDYALIENGVATDVGGNIYYYASAVRNSAVSGGEIRGGKANNGGNIAVAGSKNTKVGAILTLETNAAVYGGHAKSNGGNIYVKSFGGVTQKSGSKVYDGTCAGTGGGNVFVGTSCAYNMEGGEIYGGTNLATGGNANAGNILVQGGRTETDKENQIETFDDAYFNMSGDAKVYGGYAANQGGNIRVYIGTMTMTDNAMVYGGNAEGNTTDNIWMVDGNLIMDGKSVVKGTEDGAGSAIQGSVYRRGSNITLKGEASVYNEDGENNSIIAYTEGTHANYGNALQSKLYIDNGWTGTAYFRTPAFVAPGAAIDEIYAVCGTETDGVFTKGGSFAGKLYYGRLGNCPATGVDGALILAKNGVVKADGTSDWYETAAEALADYEYGVDRYVIIAEDAAIESDVVLDLAGQNITLSGKGTVYGMDSKNDAFEEYGTITIAEGAEIEYASNVYHPNTEYRYIALLDGSKLSFHRISMALNTVTLRTDAAGVKYKATYTCDEVLAANVTSYGTVLSLNDMPANDYETAEDINIATKHEGPIVLDEDGKLVVESDSVVGIMKAERTAEENQQIAEMQIYANVYLKVGENVFMGKGENPYADPEESQVISYSLKDVMVAINDIWTTYSEEEQATIKAFYETWKNQGMSAWASELENIVEPVDAPAVTG